MAGKHDEPSNVMRLHLEQCGLNVKQQSQTEPIWALSETILEQRDSRALALRKEPVEGVDGAFLVPDVLSDAECATLVNLCDRLGFSGGETLVEVPTKIRNNQVSLLVPPVEMVLEVAHRLRPLIPSEGCGQGKLAEPDFINRRWRVYRYAPPDGDDVANAGFFAPHFDAAQPRSAIKDGMLIDDEPVKGVTRLSQLSVLLYLTDGHEGGHTIFYPDGMAAGAEHARRVRVSPRKGAALVFWHGRHPLSPLHEGAPLTSTDTSPKYVIRTDVLFATDPPLVNDMEWGSSSYVNAMLMASANMK